MVRRIAAAMMTLMLITVTAMAELNWPDTTPALQILKNYTENVNKLLVENGESPINSLFACYPKETVMGITAEDNAEIPEGVEITVELYYDSLNTLQLRVNDIERFPRIAAALIRGLYGENMTQEEASRIPEERARKAQEAPGDSFEEPAEEMNGNMPQIYYAYEPNSYFTGQSCMQMTIIFPIAGEWDGTGMILGGDAYHGTGMLEEEEADPDYEGYYSNDDYNHFEVFSTATPEPDSAAAEYDFR